MNNLFQKFWFCVTQVDCKFAMCNAHLQKSKNSEILYFFAYKTVFFSFQDGVFFLPKQSQKSRSILQDGSRSLGLFRKGKARITAKLHRTDLIICTHSREGKTPSYSRINTVIC